MDLNTQMSMLGIVALAALLGALVGWEREKARRPAGFRTHILVASASAFLTLLGYATMHKYLLFYPTQAISNDPLRVLNAIIIGVSFIGAGVILKDEKEGKVRNLTTAASILFAAAIGVATALGQYYLATGATLFLVFVNNMLYKVEDRFIGSKADDER